MGAAPAGDAMGAAAAIRQRALNVKTGPAGLIANPRVFGVALFACLGGFLYGYNQGVFSGILAMHHFGEHMGEAVTNPDRKGWMTAILELGAWAGTLYTGVMAERISRKYTILFSVTIFIIGVVVQCTAAVDGQGEPNMLGGRFVTGLGVGSLSTVVPMYNAEVAPPEIRGTLVGLQQFAITAGIMISFWIDYGTNYIGGTGEGQSEAAWLIPLALQIAPALLLGIGMIFMPFSPRWLAHHDREEEALEVLSSLRSLPKENDLLQLEFLEIKSQSVFEKRSIQEQFPELASRTDFASTLKLEAKNFWSLFSTMPMLRRSMVATVSMFFQQFTGINAVLYYAPSIFENLGMTGNTVSLLATGVVGIVMFIATIPAVLYIDKLGRKPVLIVGAIGMALCHYIIAVIYARNEYIWEEQKASGWAAVAMVWLFVVHFGYSWGPCSWILISEIWPLSNRSKGVALGASANWMCNFIIGQVTPKMLDKLKWGTYIFFGVFTTLAALFIAFLVPETKRLTLEEMDAVFGSVGMAGAEMERMETVNREIGLTALLEKMGAGMSKGEDGSVSSVDEKRG